MRILIVNSVCGVGSTGRVCTSLAREFEASGHTVRIAYGRGPVPEADRRFALRIGNRLEIGLHLLKTRLLDGQGLGSVLATRRFLAWAEEWKPDLLWLHNLHGYYLNYELLFAWIKKHPELEVRWTLHDCWAFTGHCAYFTAVGCEQWKIVCAHCPQKHLYPASLLDRAESNFRRKQAAFTGVKNMTLITPSRWLAGLVGESFLREYPVEVLYNTVDTDVFKPTESAFRAEQGLAGKKIVLGVSNAWQEPRKGLKDMYALASLLERDRYAVVIVGLTDKLLKTVPDGVLGLGKTASPQALAAIYTAADVFVNPTYEDNYPTTNLEAQACGTPVITYDTGGSPESVPPENVVPCGDVKALAAKVRELLTAERFPA